MPELGVCIASTAHTLTLRAHCVLHLICIPFISVLTCAEQRERPPKPQTSTDVTTLAICRSYQHEQNAYVRNDTDIPERWVVHLLCGVSFCSFLFPKVYKRFDATVQKFLLKRLKLRLTPSLSRAAYACATLLLASASIALVCNFKFWFKNADFLRHFLNL